jgi:hypothetical protein
VTVVAAPRASGQRFRRWDLAPRPVVVASSARRRHPPYGRFGRVVRAGPDGNERTTGGGSRNRLRCVDCAIVSAVKYPGGSTQQYARFIIQ